MAVKEYEVTATLTVGFTYEDDPDFWPRSQEDRVEFAKEEFLEWLGSVSDTWILEGTKIEITELSKHDPEK